MCGSISGSRVLLLVSGAQNEHVINRDPQIHQGVRGSTLNTSQSPDSMKLTRALLLK